MQLPGQPVMQWLTRMRQHDDWRLLEQASSAHYNKGTHMLASCLSCRRARALGSAACHHGLSCTADDSAGARPRQAACPPWRPGGSGSAPDGGGCRPAGRAGCHSLPGPHRPTQGQLQTVRTSEPRKCADSHWGSHQRLQHWQLPKAGRSEAVPAQAAHRSTLIPMF